MNAVFLSYRRDDSAGFAGRLADALEAAFGSGSVFRDVDDIRPGEDFVDAIESHLHSVDAVLVMIGPHWLEAGADERRRLDATDDFVRLEIQAALDSGKPLIRKSATSTSAKSLASELRSPWKPPGGIRCIRRLNSWRDRWGNDAVDLSDHRQLGGRDHAGATARPFNQHAARRLGHDVAVGPRDRTATDMVDPLARFEGGLSKH